MTSSSSSTPQPASALRTSGARLAGVVWDYARAGPGTTAYLIVLLAGHVWTTSSARAPALLGWASTNVLNLGAHPWGALGVSALVVDGPLLPPDGGTIITLGLGVAVALWWVEARHGALRAAALFLGGHVGATLLTAAVIDLALHTGRYPATVRGAVDVGISYGAQASLAALAVALPRLVRPAWILFLLVWPFADVAWYGWLPDFTTVGHLFSVAIGLSLAALLLRRRSAPPHARPAARARRR